MSSAAVQSIQQATQQYPHSSPARSNLTPEQSPDLSVSPASSRRQQPAKFVPPGNGAPPNTPLSPTQNFSPPDSAPLDSPKTYQGTPQSRQASESIAPDSARAEIASQHSNPSPRQQDHVQSIRSHQHFDTPEMPGSIMVDRSREHAGSTAGGSAGNGKKKKEQRIFSEPQKTRSTRTKAGPTKSRSATALNLPSTKSPLSREVAPGKPVTSHHADADTYGTGLGLTDERVDTAQQQQQQPQQPPRSRQEHLRNAPKRETKFGDYILGQTIGEGEFGKVKMGWKKEGGAQVAIKLIRREALGNDISRRLPKIYREIKILRELDHDNIVRLYEMVETDKHIGIILEYASGGELFDHILNQRYLKDAAARPLFAQLVSGVGYLHQKGIVHRDLKLENLLLDRNRNIIITDFGFANTFDPYDQLSGEIEYNLNNKEFCKSMDLDSPNPITNHRRGDLMQTSCGSPCYAAPELVVSDSLYTGRKVDVWSCGVILYAMLAGYLPFDDDPANPEGDNINLLYKYIVTTPLTFPEYVTPHARDILRRILVPDPRHRADLFEVARHSWLNDYAHALAFITSGPTDGTSAAPVPLPIGKQKRRAESMEVELTQNPEEPRDATPVLARSASVRETVKHTLITPGGLTHPGATIIEERVPTPRDAKRRTVQVEYVAPPSQDTGRVEPQVVAQSPKISSTHVPSPRTRAHAHIGNANSPTIAGPTDSPRIAQHENPAPSLKSPRLPRAASDSSNFAVSHASPELQRPSTQGSMPGTTRLPSRGNSYARPVAATVAPTNAQGTLMQPSYVAAAGSDPSAPVGRERPLSQHLAGNYDDSKRPSTAQEHTRSKRNSAIEILTARILGRSNSARRNHQQQPTPGTAVKPERKNRMFPPVSLQNAQPTEHVVSAGSAAEIGPASAAPAAPRKSTDSRRSSFGFVRRDSIDNKRSSKRFSFLATGLSKINFGGGPAQDEIAVDNKRTSWQPQPPRSRHDSKSFLGMAFGQGRARSDSSDTGSTIPVPYNPEADERKRQPRLQQNEIQRGATAPDLLNYGTATTTEPKLNVEPISQAQAQQPHGTQASPSTRTSPIYPTRRPVGSSRRQAHSPIGQPSLATSGPTLSPNQPMQSATTTPVLTALPASANNSGLQKAQRKFGDSFDVGGHAGSSNKARSVMDWFRRRGKERSG